MKERKTVELVVSSGQYETCATTVKVTYTTENGLLRRARQLSKQHAVYGDNWTGWINAQIAIASENDVWGDNQIVGGQWCDPANGWMDLY